MLVKTTHLTEFECYVFHYSASVARVWRYKNLIITITIITLGQFQLHNLKNSDVDYVKNAQLLRLSVQIDGKT